MTVNYYSNYATSASDGVTNTVGANKNVIVKVVNCYYSNEYSSGLWNYTSTSNSFWLLRTGYTGTGKWGTSTSGGTLVDQNTTFATGQAIAKALGKDLSNGNASINVYAQWSENYLTVNYYSNGATYYSYEGVEKTIPSNDIVLTYSYYYDNAYSDGLYNVQNSSKLYLSKTGCAPTGYWGTTASGGTLVNHNTSFATGQALAQAFEKSLANGNATVNVYAQWKENSYTLDFAPNGGSGNMDSQVIEWGELFKLPNATFKREGHKFIGWNAHRNADNTWYVIGQGWITEDVILANGYTKKLYANQSELTFDQSWIKDNEEARLYTMYAVWEISGVVYIHDGTKDNPYLAYIDNGDGWDLYLVYSDDITKWIIVS